MIAPYSLSKLIEEQQERCAQTWRDAERDVQIAREKLNRAKARLDAMNWK